MLQQIAHKVKKSCPLSSKINLLSVLQKALCLCYILHLDLEVKQASSFKAFKDAVKR